MRVDLAYGRHGLAVDVPDDAVVVAPVDLAALGDPEGAVRRAVTAPSAGPTLAALVGRLGRGSVAVVFPDLTRPMPNRTVLPPLLDELARLGLGPERVELVCATGTHRQATAAEMAELIGPELAAAYRVHDHAADDGRHVMVGRVDGTPVRLDPHYTSAGLRIVTGFVEPHFFAGFSGGPKGVCPGLADTETILEAHSPARMAHPDATWTVTRGNPVHDFVRSAVALDPPELALDVAINRDRALTAVYCAPLPTGHEAACRFVGQAAVRPVGPPFDVVLATNGGHPLDRNLYQAVKGMAAAARVVRPGGTVIVAAPCGDGVGAPAFADIVTRARDAADLAATDGPSVPDRWQAIVLGRVLARAEVWLHAEGLSDDEIGRCHLRPVDDVTAAVTEALAAAGGRPRLCVLPEGPLTVATAA